MTDLNSSEFNRKSLSVLLACVVAGILGPAPILIAAGGVALTAVGQELGWSRTMFAMPPLIMAWSCALLYPLFGKWMDNGGVRRVSLPAIFVFGCALVGLSLIPSATWAFFAVYVFVGISTAAQGPTGFIKVMSQWFVRHRGAVISMVSVLASLGLGLVPQVVNYLVVHHGWRTSYLVLGLAVLLLSLPACYFFLRERGTEQSPSANAVAEMPVEEGVTLSEGLRHFSFWNLWLVLFFATAVFFGVMLHLFPMLIDEGFDREVAVTAVSVLAIGSIIGQISAAFLLDRVDSPRVALPYFGLGLLGVLFIHLGDGLLAKSAGAVMLGVGQGSIVTVIGYLVSRLFGLRAFGALCGIIFTSGAVASGVGPMILGLSFDKLGSYGPALIAGELGLMLVLILVCVLPPYAYGGVSRAGKSSPAGA